jgi:hypothetical protein
VLSQMDDAAAHATVEPEPQTHVRPSFAVGENGRRNRREPSHRRLIYSCKKLRALGTMCEMEAAARVALTDLLLGWRNGHSSALDKLTPLIYSELC